MEVRVTPFVERSGLISSDSSNVIDCFNPSELNRNALKAVAAGAPAPNVNSFV
jgi:hypothetical protein